MHPILGNLRRLVLYLLAWIPLAAIIAGLLAYSGPMQWPWACAIAGPSCLLYAFVCLGSWYLCKATPVESTAFSRLVITHGVAAIAISAVWLLQAGGLAILLEEWSYFSGIQRQEQIVRPVIFAAGLLLYLLTVALYYVMLSQQISQQAEQREARANLLARDSELKALKAQVNPHFLFNSLNSISALTTVDAARAREMCVLLADFLRATLGLGEKTQIPVKDELFLVRSFLAVEKVRFGARLDVQESIDATALELMVPPLLLQPLAENAVNHGVSNLVEGGWIKIEIKSTDGKLTMLVENKFDRETPPRKGTGTGLRNVRQRLETRYGARSEMRLDNSTDIFRVEITLPAETA